MEIWYEVPKIHGYQIIEVKVSRHSDVSIWTKGGKRRSRVTAYEVIVPTIDEAAKLLKERAENNIKRHEEAIKKAKEALELCKKYEERRLSQ